MAPMTKQISAPTEGDVFSWLNWRSTITSRKKEKGPMEKKKSFEDVLEENGSPGIKA